MKDRISSNFKPSCVDVIQRKMGKDEETIRGTLSEEFKVYFLLRYIGETRLETQIHGSVLALYLGLVRRVNKGS